MPRSVTPVDLEDLIYAARVDDLDVLEEFLHSFDTTKEAQDWLWIARDPDPDGSGNGLMHMFAANGSTRGLDWLHAQRPEHWREPGRRSGGPFMRNRHGNTPCHWAALNGHLDAVRALLEGPQREAKSPTERPSPFWPIECIEEMITAKNEAGKTPLDEAEDVAFATIGSKDGVDRAPDGRPAESSPSKHALVIQYLSEKSVEVEKARGKADVEGVPGDAEAIDSVEPVEASSMDTTD